MKDVSQSKGSFDRALRFFENGDLVTAEEICREALKEYPAEGKLQCLLGTVLVRQRRPGEALTELEEVIRNFPTFPKAHREMGNALMGLGRGQEAAEHLERVTELTPKSAVAFFDLSLALSKIGREDDAEKKMAKSYELEPEREALMAAATHQRAGRFGQAEGIYRQILSRDPNNISAIRLLGSIALEMGRVRMAIKLLTQATEMAPDYYGAWSDLARAHMETDDFLACEKTVKRAIQLQPEMAYPHMMFGNLLSKASRYEEAIEKFETALQKQPDHGGTLASLGHAQKTIGLQTEAIDSYRACIKSNPAFGEAYWSLANLKTFRFSDDEIAQMERFVDDDQLLDETRVNFNFALGKAKEDIGEFKAAFERYAQGNSLRRRAENYDPVQTEVIHDRIIETFNGEFLATHAGKGNPEPSPIFIVGLPRSGSTLIEQILASHSMVEGTFELPDMARIIRGINEESHGQEHYPEAIHRYLDSGLNELGQHYLDSTRKHRSGAPRFTDKMPNNFPSIGLIHLILPNAKIINAKRHPLDSCMGTYKQLFYKGQAFSYDLLELGEYYLEYNRIMGHWHSVLPGRVLDVNYEDMVANQEDETKRILEYCELPFEQACLHFYETDRAINTASSEQVRQPIYAASLNAYKRFESDLGPLIEILAPLLPKNSKEY